MNKVYNIDCPKERTALDLTERLLSEIFEPSGSLVTVAFLIAPFISCILLSKQKDHLERWSEISYFYTHSLARKVPTHPFVTYTYISQLKRTIVLFFSCLMLLEFVITYSAPDRNSSRRLQRRESSSWADDKNRHGIVEKQKSVSI